MMWEPMLLRGNTLACAWAFAWVCLCFLVSVTWGLFYFVPCLWIFLASCSFHVLCWMSECWQLPVSMSCSDSCRSFRVQLGFSFLTVRAMWRRHRIRQMKRLGTLLPQTPMQTGIHLRMSQVLPQFQFLSELCMTTRARSRMSWASKQVQEHQGKRFFFFTTAYKGIELLSPENWNCTFFTGHHCVCSGSPLGPKGTEYWGRHNCSVHIDNVYPAT